MHSLEAEQREAEIKRQGQLGFDVHKLESDFKQAKKYNCDLEKETSSIKNMIESQQSLSSSLMEEVSHTISAIMGCKLAQRVAFLRMTVKATVVMCRVRNPACTTTKLPQGAGAI